MLTILLRIIIGHFSLPARLRGRLKTSLLRIIVPARTIDAIGTACLSLRQL